MSSSVGHAACRRNVFGLVCNERATSWVQELPHLPRKSSGYRWPVWINPYTPVGFYRQAARRLVRREEMVRLPPLARGRPVQAYLRHMPGLRKQVYGLTPASP